MKKISLKIAMAALLFAVGTLGLNAQFGRGGSMLGVGTGVCGTGTGIGIGTGTGNCSYLALLTDEQKVELQEINDAFQAAMLELSTAKLAAVTLAEKIEIFNQMTALRDAHFAEVKAYLASIGITVTTGLGSKGGGKMTGAGKSRGRKG